MESPNGLSNAYPIFLMEFNMSGPSESDLSADTRPKTGQMPKGTALLHSAQFLAESGKLTDPSNSVCVIGGGFLNGFTADMAAISTPGVIRGRGVGGLDVVVEGFGIHDFGLADGLVVEGVR